MITRPDHALSTVHQVQNMAKPPPAKIICISSQNVNMCKMSSPATHGEEEKSEAIVRRLIPPSNSPAPSEQFVSTEKCDR